MKENLNLKIFPPDKSFANSISKPYFKMCLQQRARSRVIELVKYSTSLD